MGHHSPRQFCSSSGFISTLHAVDCHKLGRPLHGSLPRVEFRPSQTFCPALSCPTDRADNAKVFKAFMNISLCFPTQSSGTRPGAHSEWHCLQLPFDIYKYKYISHDSLTQFKSQRLIFLVFEFHLTHPTFIVFFFFNSDVLLFSRFRWLISAEE
jgi:hypothetical protein